jgi:hypothetical protein
VDVFENRTVYTLLADYQGRANGGDGWLRILRFVPASNRVEVQTYSPWLDAYETDTDSEFVLYYDMSGVPFDFLGTVTALSGNTATLPWSDRTPDLYEWYVVADDSSSATRSATWSFTIP